MSDTDPVDRESPILLDPKIHDDTQLLWFLEDGSVVFRDADAPADDLNRRRAECSMEIYDLNGIKLQEARRDKMRSIRRMIEDADASLALSVLDEPDGKSDERLTRTVQLLFELVAESAEYSVAAFHALLALRDSPTASSILSQLQRLKG
jgi:hypothetical protein